MLTCENEAKYEILEKLLKKVSNKERLKPFENSVLINYLKQWKNETCNQKGCRPDTCSYGLALDWVQFHGYINLAELIHYIDLSKPLDEIKNRKSFDVLKADWARRPGHYNG